MNPFFLIFFGLVGASLLCALLIVSSSVVASRSTKRLASQQMADLTEEAQALQTLSNTTAKPQKGRSAHPVLP